MNYTKRGVERKLLFILYLFTKPNFFLYTSGAGDNFKPEFRGGMGGIGRGRGGPPATSGGFGAPPPS